MRGNIRKDHSSASGGVSRSALKKGNTAAAVGVFYVPQSSEDISPAGKPSSKASRGKAKIEEDESIDGEESGYQETGFDVTALSAAIEGISDKRPSSREKALNQLLSLMRGAHAKESLESLQDSYFESTQSGISKILSRPATSNEGESAMSVLCMLGLLIGPHEEAFFEKYSPVLTSLLESDDLQASALFALTFLSFICSDASNAQMADLCESILCEEAQAISVDVEVSEQLRVQAVASWTLLASRLDGGEILERSQERVFSVLAEMLEESSIEAKLAAGEGLSLLWEVADEIQPDANDASELSDLLCSEPGAVAKALVGLKHAAKESSRHVSKRDKKEQRHAFREFSSWIVNGQAPEEKVRFCGADYTARSFRELRLLADLRRVLGDCFERGVQIFPLVLDLIGLDARALQNESLLGEQTRKGSSVEKRRAAWRKQDRRYKGGETLPDSEDLY